MNNTIPRTTKNAQFSTKNVPFITKDTKSLQKYVKILNKGFFNAILTLDYVDTKNNIDTRERQTGQILTGQDYGFSKYFIFFIYLKDKIP